ncbi:MAG: GDSL-type esterase/lipase family protein [Lactobacillaceae bacterium]|jgi:lysophospholipase L1-like esterase|nr:GDSL-type esterase/lipase family protein [Lactobacillaceae bacterium]
MTEEKTSELTKLHPKLIEFQNQIRDAYDQENKIAEKSQIVFAGSSLMEIFPIEKFQQEDNLKLPLKIYNRGVRATTTQDILDHINTIILDLLPSKLFINIGSNDLGFGISVEEMSANYKAIIKKVREKLPKIEIYLMAFYPINEHDDFTNDRADHGRFADKRSNASLINATAEVAKLAGIMNVNFINVNAGLYNQVGDLKPEFTFDGAHLTENAYKIVLENLMPYLEK